MPSLEWKKSYQIGHSEIDQQHRHLVSIYNRLYDEVMHGTRDTSEVQVEILEEILEYTCYHFSCEEALMKEINFPQASFHWRLHKNFENRIYQLYRSKNSETFVLNSEVLKILKDWLNDHILKEDQQIGKYLCKQGLR